MGKDLKYFLREELKTEEVLDMQGPLTITDEEGKPLIFKVKRLSSSTIDNIYAHYKKNKPALDKGGKPYVVDGKLVMQEEKDYSKAFRHIIVESLVYPDLHDEKLKTFFDCHDITELPRKMFTVKELAYISNMVSQVLGLSEETEDEQKEDFESAKN